MAKASGASVVRVIGGELKGRKIRFHDAPGLRPTPNRVRETLFNWLRPQIAGSRCLDLFAGSGALGIEALSQGAAHVTFVESSKRAAATLEQTLREFRVTDKSQVVVRRAEQFLAGPPEACDIVFLDPPFHKDLLAPICELLARGGWLKPEALVYIESEKALQDLPIPQPWVMMREKVSGDVRYSLFHT